MAEHRRPADEGADESAFELRGDERRDEPLRDVEQDHRRAQPRAEAAPDVGGADVAAAELADVRRLKTRTSQYAEREAAGQVAGHDQERVAVVIWG